MRKPFRLQRLLDVRSRQVDACKTQLSERVRELQTSEETLKAIEERGESLSSLWLGVVSAGLSAWQAVDFERAWLKQIRDLGIEQAEVDRLRKAAAVARGELEQAMIRVKTLEKARDREIRRAETEEARLEQASLDEYSILMEARG